MTIDVRTAESLGKNIIEQVVVRGDTANLSPEEKAKYYISLCASLGLNPATQPIEFIRFQGREIAYVKRGGADQMAAMHKLNRETIEGPEIRKVGNMDIVYCKVRVTHPNGRIETAIGTLPLKDPTMDLMKCESKSKRRGTLSILGLGMLDESEIEGMLDGQSASAASPPRLDPAGDDPIPQSIIDALAEYKVTMDESGKVSSVSRLTLSEATAVLLKHEEKIAGESYQRIEDVVRMALADNMGKREFWRALDFARWAQWIRKAHSLEELKDVVEQINKGKKAAHWQVKEQAVQEMKDKAAAMVVARKAELTPPTPPNGGTKPEAPAVDVDEERAAIAEADSTAPQAVASEVTGDVLPRTMLIHKLAECTVHQHLLNTLLKYGPGAVPQDEAVQIAAERMQALGANYLTAAKAIRDEIDRRGGWKQSRKAA